MIETAKTTSIVFIILIGAAMLTSAFRGFGGEEWVKEFLGDLPGGFWTQFLKLKRRCNCSMKAWRSS